MQSVDLDMFGPSTPGGQHGVVREESDEAMLSKKQREEVEQARNGNNILDSSKEREGSRGDSTTLQNQDIQIRDNGADASSLLDPSHDPEKRSSCSQNQQIPEKPPQVGEEPTVSIMGALQNITSSVVESSIGGAPIMHVVKAPMPRKRESAPSRGAWRFSATIPEEPFAPKVQIVLPKDSPLHSLILPPSKKIENFKPKPKETEKVPVKRIGKAKPVKKKPVIKKVKYKCFACGKKVMCLEMIKSHLCLPRLQCLDCLPSEVVLPSRPLLLHHLETDHPNVSLPCEQCDQEFHSKTLLKWHAKVHEIERQKSEEVAVTQAVTNALEAAIANENSKTQKEKITPENKLMDTVPQAAGSVELEVTPQEVVDEFHDNDELDNLPSESVVELDVPVTTIPDSSTPGDLETMVEISRRDEEHEDAPPTPLSVPTPSQTPTFECSKCKKTFNTRLRFNNHRLRCGLEVKMEPTTARPSKKPNARFQLFSTVSNLS